MTDEADNIDGRLDGPADELDDPLAGVSSLGRMMFGWGLLLALAALFTALAFAWM